MVDDSSEANLFHSPQGEKNGLQSFRIKLINTGVDSYVDELANQHNYQRAWTPASMQSSYEITALLWIH